MFACKTSKWDKPGEINKTHSYFTFGVYKRQNVWEKNPHDVSLSHQSATGLKSSLNLSVRRDSPIANDTM